MVPVALILALLLTGGAMGAAPALDERGEKEGEWGFRPAAGSDCAVTPPAFTWRPQKGIAAWEVECCRGDQCSDGTIAYRADGIAWNVHCPAKVLPPGRYTWRYRGVAPSGEKTAWSRGRTFQIVEGAVPMPLAPRGELLARIPKAHPRLFLRPEDLPRLRELAQGPLAPRLKKLEAECRKLLDRPPPTAEPPKYPQGTKPLSEEWREIWWGNRLYTIEALDGAATLAFTRLLTGDERYGTLARRILMECARWDPRGATGYRYNDEAGMPYASRFSRTYTFLHDLLSEEERAVCRGVMKVRGEEMFAHLCPRILWRPFDSHANRAWHFLGEVGVAFLGEIEGADEWVWFAMNYFATVYPVWADPDGGWHEGASYWNSYLERFTWWADIMQSAMGVRAYDKPYFSKAGYFAMYMMPPHKRGGGFGDLAADRRAQQNVPLMSVLAAQSGNGHWQWYVEQMGGPVESEGYVGFVRGAQPRVKAQPPDDLPTSRVFRGTGVTCLNSTLLDARQGVQVAFKSSPMGTQSHGYDANNAFQLAAYGEPLLVSSGRRDVHGSEHHRLWMWNTRSVNSITVDGRGQTPHSASSKGRIVAFQTTPEIDVVVGEAADSYPWLDEANPAAGRLLERFTRAIIFVKPELLVVFDQLVARRDVTFEYRLHAPSEFKVTDQRDIAIGRGGAACAIALLAPEGLNITQTDRCDPDPRPRVQLREWHLTAATAAKTRSAEFVALFRPHRRGEKVPLGALLQRTAAGYTLRAALADGRVTLLLPVAGAGRVAAGIQGPQAIVVHRLAADGSARQSLTVDAAW